MDLHGAVHSAPELDTALQALLGDAGLRLVPSDACAAAVVEAQYGVVDLWARCRAAVSAIPAGGTMIVVISADQLGIARLLRWLLLPVQLVVASRAIRGGRATVLGRLAVYPGLPRSAIVYELHSSAAVYAERLLLPHASEGAIMRTIRRLLSAWAGCDPAIGAIVVVGEKR